LSAGRISFPWLRENGYAFFDGRVYGHAPGQIFDEKGCWLWFNRKTVAVSNPQINTLTAYNENKFFAILTNQAREPQSAEITFSSDMLGINLENVKTVTVRGVDGAREIELNQGVVRVDFKSRELLVVEVEGTKIDVASHRLPVAQVAGNIPAEVEVKAGGITVKAAAIAVEQGPWDAFIWCAADPQQVKIVTLETKTNGVWESQSDSAYPFEFSVPMDASEKVLQFRVFGESPSGEKFSTGTLVVGNP